MLSIESKDSHDLGAGVLAHHYGSQVHLLDSPALQSVLAQVCSVETVQPKMNQLIRYLYSQFIRTVIDREFPNEIFESSTRMTAQSNGVTLKGTRIAPTQKAVVVDLARAGILPSEVVFENLHHVLNPENVRQDHIFASRKTNEQHEVISTDFGAVKIGGDVDKAIVLIPDPMGATGSTSIATIDYYKKQVPGLAVKYIMMHLIVTPEYLKNVVTHHPEAKIYALRLDRGLSSKSVLSSTLGVYWDQEKGLNACDYIVPGGGGFGELMNNSFV